jgi:acetyl esterase/lipase
MYMGITWKGSGTPPPATAGTTNPYVIGVLIRATWERLDPTLSGTVNTTWLEQYVSNCEQNGKKAALEILAGNFCPPNIWSVAGAQMLDLDKYGPSTVPWDPIFQARWEAAQAQLAAQFDGRLAYVKLIGVGHSSESFLVCQVRAQNPECENDLNEARALAVAAGYPEPPGATPQTHAEVTAWIAGGKWMIDMFARRWPRTQIVQGVGPPYGPDDISDGTYALRQIMDYGKATYAGRFGIRADDLAVISPVEGQPSGEYVKEFAPLALATGFQYHATVIDVDHTPPIAFDQSLDRGVDIFHANFLEVFPRDCDEPCYRQGLVKATNKMNGWATPTPAGTPCNIASPTPTATGTPSPSPTPTATPTATFTPTPTPTPTPSGTPPIDTVTKITEQYGVGHHPTAGDTVLQWNIYVHSTANPRKAVIVMFGGHWNTGNRGAVDSQARDLANAGYTVMAIDTRLAPPHTDFPPQAVGDNGWFPEAQNDMATAVLAARNGTTAASAGKVNGRVAIVGGSSGGNLAAYNGAAMTNVPADKADCIVSLSGIYDLHDAASLDEGVPCSGDYDGFIFNYVNSNDRSTNGPLDNASPYKRFTAASSPFYFVATNRDIIPPFQFDIMNTKALTSGMVYQSRLITEAPQPNGCTRHSYAYWDDVLSDILTFLSAHL